MQNKYSLSCINSWTIAIPSSQKHKRFWSVGCQLFGRRSGWVGGGQRRLGFQEKLFSGMSANGKIGMKFKYQCCCWQILELMFCLCSSPLGVILCPLHSLLWPYKAKQSTKLMSKLLLAPCFVLVQEKIGLYLLCYFMVWGPGNYFTVFKFFKLL